MDAKKIALTPERRLQIEGRQTNSSLVKPIFGTYYAKDTADLLAEVDRLRAENDSLKVDAVNWGAWRERVAAEFFQSDRFGMNDIWIAISALIRQRDEAREDRDRIHFEALNPADVAVKVLALTARAEAAEKERDEALQSFRAAIELEGPQKYATLLDERDALAGRLEAVERQRDEAQRKAWPLGPKIKGWLFALIERAEAAERKNAAMREALKESRDLTGRLLSLAVFKSGSGFGGITGDDVRVVAAQADHALSTDPAPEPNIPPSC